MEDWLGVIKLANLKKSLDCILSAKSKPAAFKSSQDPMQRLLNSIIGLANQNMGLKWLSNAPQCPYEDHGTLLLLIC